MLESLESELCALIAFCCGSAEVTEVRGYAGHSENAGLLVQDIKNFVYSETFSVGNRLNNCRIHITGTCSHDEAFKRSKTHGCIHALAADRCGDGGAVAEVADNDSLMSFRKLSILNRLCGNEHVAGSVETIAADRIFLIVLRIDTVHVSMRLHTHAESCIEYSYVRLARHSCLACFNTHKVCGIMKRSEREALFDCFLDLIVDQ